MRSPERQGHDLQLDSQSRVRGEVLSSGLVEHVRADGYHYRPSERVDWMVCDIADRPGRVAALVACWLGERWCEQCLFNFKLPMKRRTEALCHAKDEISAALDRSRLRHRPLQAPLP